MVEQKRKDYSKFSSDVTGLLNHIQNNHFPPPRLDQIQNIVVACDLAISLINKGEPDKVICQVNGVEATAAKIAEDWHLWDPAFINQEVFDEG